jgi:hypothetical protein
MGLKPLPPMAEFAYDAALKSHDIGLLHMTAPRAQASGEQRAAVRALHQKSHGDILRQVA